MTSALTTKQGQIKHFSKAAGKISLVLQERYLVNPLPIPLTLKKALASPDNLREVVDLALFTSEFQNKLKDIRKSFYTEALHAENRELIVIENLDSVFPTEENLVTVEEFYLPVEKRPTDGYWWPHIGAPLANGPNSPLAKYDAYVASAGGANPNSVEWELENHNSNVEWAGHCNGWASSAILHGYDNVNLKDEANGAIITSSDLQGLRSVLSYCTHNAFYGARYRGENSDLKDINPRSFHLVLKYYLKGLKKPVVYDFLNSPPVDSHIISGYKLTYERTETEGKFLVTAELKSHKYSDTFVHERRVAPAYTRTYQYYLWQSRRGSPLKAQWVDNSDHPDFVWIPLSESRCGRENPRVQTKWLNHMLENLEHLLSE